MQLEKDRRKGDWEVGMERVVVGVGVFVVRERG